MSEQREDGLRSEDVADATPSDAPQAAEPAEEHLAEAPPDDARGAAGGATDGAPAAAQETDDPAAALDFKDRYVRAMAELDNVRKRARRDVGAAEARGVVKLAREVLPAVDDLERALHAAPEDDPMRNGVAAIHQRLIAALARLGIEADAPQGQTFDPHRHEAVAQQPVEGAQSGTIVEVYANGYHLGDEVLRAAKVVVAR